METVASQKEQMIDHAAIGRRLEVIRLEHHLTEWEMRSRLGLSAASYRNFVAGRRQLPITLLHALQRDFGANLNWFVGGAR